MNKWSQTIWLVLFSLLMGASINNAQEGRPPRVSTSIGIYDVESRDDIHKFSASEIRELVQMENRRAQNERTVPHPVLVYCFEDRYFQHTSEKYQDRRIRYRLHTPKTIRYGKKYPLIVYLHGNADDSLIHLHSILPMLIGPERQDFFLLATQAPRDRGGYFFSPTKDGPLDVLVAAMEHVIAENPIDKKRITVTGVSGGGWGAWELVLRHPNLFAGAVPAASGAPPPSHRLAALKQTPIWSFTNKGDRLVSPETNWAAMRMINNSGGSMAFTELNVSGHNAWRPAVETHDCLQWALAQKRGSWFSPPPGVIVHKPNSLLFIFAMYILPIVIITVFLPWGTIYERATTACQAAWERIGNG